MNIIEQLKRHEGLSLKVYQCPAHKWTIGYGRNLEDNGISEAEAESMLRRDVALVRYQLLNCEHSKTFDYLGQVRQAVLINMGYNIGIKSLMGFKKMWAALDMKDYHEAAIQILSSRYAKQVGKRADELAAQMDTGEWAA